MAKIFAVQGAEQRGSALGELPWLTCRGLFEIDDMSGTEDRPRFGSGNKAAVFPTHLVVQVGDHEAQHHGLTARYFLSPLPFEQARARLNDYRPSR